MSLLFPGKNLNTFRRILGPHFSPWKSSKRLQISTGKSEFIWFSSYRGIGQNEIPIQSLLKILFRNDVSGYLIYSPQHYSDRWHRAARGGGTPCSGRVGCLSYFLGFQIDDLGLVPQKWVKCNQWHLKRSTEIPLGCLNMLVCLYVFVCVCVCVCVCLYVCLCVFQ